MSWFSDTTNALGITRNSDPGGHLAATGQQAGQFGATNAFNFNGADRAQMMQQMAYQNALAHGQNSVSAEQLRQGLQQNVAAQQSMAAGAAPQNQVMAARTAMMQTGRLGAGLAGQQAVAGLQERQQASQLAAQLAEQMRQQSLQATLGGQGGAISAYASGAGNSIANPTAAQNVGGAIQGGSTLLGLGGGGGNGGGSSDTDKAAALAMSGLI